MKKCLAECIGTLALVFCGTGAIIHNRMDSQFLSDAGVSMNLFRSLAPALVSGVLKYSWIYLTAPVLGMVYAVYVHKIIK